MAVPRFLKIDLRPLFFRQYWHRTSGMLGFAVFLGIALGLIAVAFHGMLDYVQGMVLDRLAGFPFGDEAHPLPRYLFFLVPAAGGLLSGWLVYSFAPDAAGAGIDALIDAYHNKAGHIPFRVTLVKFFSSIITLGSGGSAGQEGPIAQVGGGIGSLLGRILRLPDRLRRILLLTGTAAGLGAIFHAPLGGALTAAEVVYQEDFESQGFLPFTVASVVAFAVFTLISHQKSVYLQFPIFPFTHFSELLIYAGVGAACAPFSWAFVRLYQGVQGYARRSRVPDFCKPAIGGLVVGLTAYACPQAVGTGWNHLIHSVSGDFAFSALLFIALAKIFTTSVTIGSGGSGGVFGPSLFIGGMVGGAVGFGLHGLNPAWIVNPGSYVLVGMGAFFAGAAKAPLAGQIMVCEITGNYGLLPPLLLASTVHLVLSRKWTLYDSQRHNKFSSPVHEHALKKDILKKVSLKEVFSPESRPFVIGEGVKADAVLREVSDLEDEICPVVGTNGKIVGLVSRDSLRKAALEPEALPLLLINDMMTPPHFLKLSMDLHRALSVFLQSGAAQLPVVDEDQKPLGLVRPHDIMREYHRLTDEAERAGEP